MIAEWRRTFTHKIYYADIMNFFIVAMVRILERIFSFGERWNFPFHGAIV
jgi:hypothetical protein